MFTSFTSLFAVRFFFHWPKPMNFTNKNAWNFLHTTRFPKMLSLRNYRRCSEHFRTLSKTTKNLPRTARVGRYLTAKNRIFFLLIRQLPRSPPLTMHKKLSCWLKAKGRCFSATDVKLVRETLRVSTEIYSPRKKNRHLASPPLVSPRNDVWRTGAEVPYWWRVNTRI